MASSEFQVRLYRDSFSTPWGFRLQGGKDFKTPLTIQRVFVGSPAEGELHRGDIINAIENYDASHMTHKQAQDVIKGCGGSCSLRIKRGGSQYNAAPTMQPFTGYTQPVQPAQLYRPQPFCPPQKTPTNSAPSFGVDYSQPRKPDTNYIGEIAQQGDEDYNHKPVSEIKRMFTNAPVRNNMDFSQNRGLKEPGWTPNSSRPKPQQSWAPIRAPNTNAPIPVNRAPMEVNRFEQQSSAPPAWMGTLKNSGTLKPWEVNRSNEISGQQPPAQRVNFKSVSPNPDVQAVHQPRVQNIHHGFDGPQYQQVADQNSDTAQVKHLQYNSPLALYSRENAKEALVSQTTGRPGQGTLQVTGGPGSKNFNMQDSETYRLIQESENRRAPQAYNQRNVNQSPAKPQFAGASDF
ncbi:DgyrCDS12411 [Dimorphilus gyrociliatus]|uniref:DgyrCDS12411 n=1 Tax=Dimorphilus gyrociliatus TaxID=2664684 RepID=A0A7I8W7C9_9ANNE|nr:DgyrCDS12411 [Dimorphilus gyrociliatus]